MSPARASSLEPGPRVSGITPLGIIATFVALSETVAGLAAIKTENAVQLIFAIFAVGFPVLVAAVFFAVLWKRAYVFYSPREFGGSVDVSQYVEAMRSQAIGNTEILELVQTSISAALESNEGHAVLSQVAVLPHDEAGGMLQASEVLVQRAVESLHGSLVTADISAFSSAEGSSTVLLPYRPDEPAFGFLSAIYYQICDHVEAFTYGKSWVLKDAASGAWMLPEGVRWDEADAVANSGLTEEEFGLRAGMTVRAMRLSDRQAKAIRVGLRSG